MGFSESRARCLWASLLILVILIPGGFANAQSLFGGGLPGMSSFGEFAAGPTACAPAKSVYGPFTFYAGWGDDRKGTTISFDRRHGNFGDSADDLNTITNTYQLRGLWLGAAAEGNLTGKIGASADFWILVPSNQQSQERFAFGVTPQGGKNWATSTNWWFVDGTLSYDSCGLGKLLAGFRYDRFATNFSDPSNFTIVGGSGTDTGDVTINCYVPFVGIQTDQICGGANRITFRVIGFPWLGGDVQYHDTIGSGALTLDRIEMSKGVGNGYFLEAFGECSRSVLGSGQVGVFARWTALHGTAESIPIEDVLGGVLNTGRYNFSFDRQNFTIGGSVSLDFNMALPGIW